MKVFSFSVELVYNYGVRKEFQGFFVKDNTNRIKGYLEENKGAKNLLSLIEGLYDEETGKILFVKAETAVGEKPEIYIFEDSYVDGWVSAYHRIYETFSVYGGVRNGTAKINTLRQIYELDTGIGKPFSKVIEDEYNNLYSNLNKLSKKFIEDVTKYEWLFKFVKHLKRSAK